MARIDNNAFSQKNKSKQKEPRWVVRIDFSTNGTDYVYFTSHSDITGISGTTHNNVVAKLSTVSQHIQPEKGISSVGNLSFSLIDKDNAITTLLRDKLDAGNGLRKKEVVVYFGYKDIDFSTFIPLQTQLIDRDIVQTDGEYTFNCSDINRNLKANIFDLRVSNLARTMTNSQTFMYTYESDWEFCSHGTSYSDAPNVDVFYVKIEDEIVRVTASAADTSQGEALYKLTLVRGVLGTVPDQHDFNESTTEPDKRPEVTEIVYLELPMPKLVYALVSGDLYNQGGSTFPSNWTINLSGSFIRLTDYVNIGNDWWNPSDDSVGKILRFIGEEKQECKSFLERQVLLPFGAIMPIYGTGEQGIKKTTNVMADAPSTVTLDASNISKISGLKHDLASVVNDIVVNWNYDILLEDFTRTHVLDDPLSKAAHQETNPRTYNYRGVHGSRDTYSTIKSMFDNFRDRFSGPPLRLSVSCQPSHNTIEVGDVVWVNASHVRDFSNGTTVTLNRAFEVQKISTSMDTGVIKLELFGSSQKAGLVKNIDDAPVMADSFYSTAGTNLASLPETSVVGSVLHIDTDLNLTGHIDATSASATYYATQDLQLDSGITLTVNDNVQIRCKGHFQVDGDIDGDARGIVGGTGTTSVSPISTTGGAYGASESGGGIDEMWATYQDKGTSRSVQGVASTASVTGNSVPVFDINYTSSVLYNLPTELRGVPGSPGCGANQGAGFPDVDDFIAAGGNGGTSGAGLIIISRGMSFGASGSIHLNGEDGSVGQNLQRDDLFAFQYGAAGGGGGGCGGGLFYLADGSGSVTPNLFSKFSSVRGKTPSAVTDPFANRYTLTNPALHKYSLLPGVGFQVTYSFYYGHGAAVDNGKSMYRTQYVPQVFPIAEDATAYAPRPTNVVATEFLNTPKSQKANLSTIQVVVSPPNSTAYSHATVFYRENGKRDWYEVGAADDTTTFVVPSDGKIYEIFAKTVSYTKKVGKGGTGTSIATTNIENPLADLAILQVPNVTGLEIFNQGNDTVFTGKEVKIEWRKSSLDEWYNLGAEPVTQGSGVGGEDLFFRDYEVVVFDSSSGDELRTEYVTDNFYFYSHEKNFEDTSGSPTRSLRFEVRQRSRQNSFSVRTAKLVVTNTAPAVPTLSVLPGLKSYLIDIPASPDLDWKGTKVYHDTTSPVTIDASTLVFSDEVQSPVIQNLDANQLYYFHVLQYDEFGDGTLSAEFSVTTNGVLSADLDTSPPTDPTSLILSSSAEDSALYVKSEVSCSWTASTDDSGQPITYTVEYFDDVDATKIQIQTTNLVHRITDAVVGRTYSVRVRATDWAANDSSWTTIDTQLAAGDTTAVANVTGAVGTIGLDKVILNWTNPTSTSWLQTKVYRGATAGFTPSDATNMIYDGRADTMVDADVVNETAYYYKFKTRTASGVDSTASTAIGSYTPFKMGSANVDDYMAANTIDANLIVANTITASEIATGTITANEMTVSQLSAITADMGSLTAGTITGGTVRTAASGARVQLISTGLEVYDATTRRVHLSNDGSGYIGSASDFSWTTAGVLTVAKINATSGDIGGFDITSTVLKNAASTLVLNSSNNQLSVGSTTFGGAGFQTKYTGSYGEMYVGDGDENYLKYTNTDGLRLGRDTTLHGTNTWGSSTIHEIYTDFTSGRIDKVALAGLYGGSGWNTGGLAGAYYLRTDLNLASGVRMPMIQDLSFVGGKFNSFRGIKSKFMVTGQLTNMQMEFISGSGNNYFGFEMNTSGQIKAISRKTGQAKYTSGVLYTVSLDTPFTLEAFYDPDVPHIRWYIGGTLKTTQTTTTYHPNNTDGVYDWWTLDWWTTSTSSAEGKINMNAIEFINEPT